MEAAGPVTGVIAPVLEVREVTKRFAGVTALDQVSFELQPGEVHALVGENGAGKSTLIKVMTGVHEPDAGDVRYLGEPVHFRGPRDAQAVGISTIYQEVNLIPLLSVARNLFLGREPMARFGLVDFTQMHRQAAAIMGRYGIEVDVRRPLGELSIGIQQAVAIARAVSANHRVVIMDEPTSSLEQREAERLFRVIEQLRTEGVAVLYVSHRLDEVFRLCDRVTVLRDGKLVHVGPLRDLTRLQLIALMLGRKVADVSASLTRFKEDIGAGQEVLLEASDLTRRHTLSDVNVVVRRGEVVGLAGLLGSGRTSTAKAIYGAMPLDDGTVVVDGITVRRGSIIAAIRAGVGLIPEDRKAEGVVPALSVRDNITLGSLPAVSRFGFLSRSRQDRVAASMIKRLGIKASSPNQRVSELSGGNQQKVLLARVLAVTPKLLLLDDPTRGIDVGATAEIQALISELARGGLGVILSSSELEEIVEGASTVVVLRDGAVVGTLNGAEVTEDRILDLIATPADAASTDGAPPPSGDAHA
jgi:ribose transport system ATP-binding protein